MAAWTMQPATCTHQRLAVVLVSAAFVGGRAVAIGGALASFWRLLLTSPATKTFARNLIRTARPLLSGPFSVVSSPSGFALADPREQPPSRGLNPPHQGAGPRPPQLTKRRRPNADTPFRRVWRPDLPASPCRSCWRSRSSAHWSLRSAAASWPPSGPARSAAATASRGALTDLLARASSLPPLQQPKITQLVPNLPAVC